MRFIQPVAGICIEQMERLITMMSGDWRRLGFTLIEMLVVIAIIAVLAGLIASVAMRSTRTAARTACMNNLKQIGAGLNIYLQQSDYRLPFCTMKPSAPPAGEEGLPGIADTLLSACGGDRQIFRCPEDPDQNYFKAEGCSYEWQSALNINGKPVNPQTLKLLGHERFILMDYDNFHETSGTDGSAKNYLYADGKVTERAQ